MEHQDFVIGESFWTVTGEFRCTDIGSRVVVAVEIGPRERVDPSWLNGPPYAVGELVFDEDSQVACFHSRAELIADQED